MTRYRLSSLFLIISTCLWKWSALGRIPCPSPLVILSLTSLSLSMGCHSPCDWDPVFSSVLGSCSPWADGHHMLFQTGPSDFSSGLLLMRSPFLKHSLPYGSSPSYMVPGYLFSCTQYCTFLLYSTLDKLDILLFSRCGLYLADSSPLLKTVSSTQKLPLNIPSLTPNPCPMLIEGLLFLHGLLKCNFCINSLSPILWFSG